jgi:hypothetical protein
MSEPKELALEISEQSYNLLAAADADVAAATDRRNLILSATFAVARIPEAQVNRIAKQDDKIILYYAIPNGTGKDGG